MACILLWSSAVRVHDSQAYWKMDEPSSVITKPRYLNLCFLACPRRALFVRIVRVFGSHQHRSQSPRMCHHTPPHRSPFQLVWRWMYWGPLVDCQGQKILRILDMTVPLMIRGGMMCDPSIGMFPMVSCTSLCRVLWIPGIFFFCILWCRGR